MANARSRRRKLTHSRQRAAEAAEAAHAAVPLKVVRQQRQARQQAKAPPPVATGPVHVRPPVAAWPTHGVGERSAEYDAAYRLRKLWDAATPGMSAGVGHPSAAGIAAQAKGWQGDLDREASEAAAKAWRGYNDAMDALSRECGRGVRDLVWSAVIEDIGDRCPPKVREGLTFLARYWRLGA